MSLAHNQELLLAAHAVAEALVTSRDVPAAPAPASLRSYRGDWSAGRLFLAAVVLVADRHQAGQRRDT
ncbi:hypothetical protein ETD86_37385 [Nonomuraea turkmeniaca]|uniref:Uncharacterized protein n=1 Tax=Nonomuraea turkmeniaca TaxID=103838 RepID=A0A5S4F4B6_9ACTN|nr:hypothetical protein [Nonomuraea turkmeniaca]TMR10992.1 hypothetical protein ETD86_37385 [Nonomuraea turkmeniaca]